MWFEIFSTFGMLTVFSGIASEPWSGALAIILVNLGWFVVWVADTHIKHKKIKRLLDDKGLLRAALIMRGVSLYEIDEIAPWYEPADDEEFDTEDGEDN